MLRLLERHTDTLINQTRRIPQQILESVTNKQMQTFSFNPPINLVEEGKRLLGVTSFERTNSVFTKTIGNNSFSINIPSHWNAISAEKTIDELNNF